MKKRYISFLKCILALLDDSPELSYTDRIIIDLIHDELHDLGATLKRR